MRQPKPETHISGTMTDRIEIPITLGFLTTASSTIILTSNFKQCLTADTQNWNCSCCFGDNLAISGCPSLSQSLYGTFSSLSRSKIPTVSLEVPRHTCRSSKNITMPGLAAILLVPVVKLSPSKSLSIVSGLLLENNMHIVFTARQHSLLCRAIL